MTIMLGRRTLLKGMAGTAGAVLLGACKNSSAEGVRTLRIESWTQLGYPGPFSYTGGPGYWRMSLLFDTLLWRDGSGKEVPWLASSHTRSEDGLVHTLELREVTWDDGRPLTAADVAFTYEYYTTKQFTPLLIAVPRKGFAVKALGERTVEFRLDRPDVTFTQKVLGSMPIVPQHVWSQVDDPMSESDPKKVLIGTGAYKLDSRNVTQDTEAYVANPRYFLGTPYVPRIEMLPSANEDPLGALRNRQLDAAASDDGGVRDEVLAPFRDDPDQYGIVTREAGFGFPLFFNISKGGALADVRFRRACLHAIDRQDIVDRLLTGNAQVGSAGWLPPSSPYHEPDVPRYPFSRVEAERLLDEAGYRRAGGGTRTNPDGGRLRLKLNFPDSVPVALTEVISESLKAVGIELELQTTDLVRVFGMKLQESYDLLVQLYPGPSGVTLEGDPDILRGVYHTNPPNATHKATGYSNPEVDRLLDEQVTTLDDEKRKQLVARIQRLVAEDLPVAMLYTTKFFYVFRKSVFDAWYFTPGGFGPGIPDVYNKHAYITGRQEGLQIKKR